MAGKDAFREFGDALIGDWTTQSEHRLLPGTVIDGRCSFEWLEPGTFMIWRESVTHPEFPGSSLGVIGGSVELRMHYFDSRGVVRLFEMRVADDSWTFTRVEQDDFDQRLTWMLAADGTIRGSAQMHEDGEWVDDLWGVYRRA